MKKYTCVITLILWSLFPMAQNVGIGTNTPVAKLDVKDTIKAVLKIGSKNYLDTTQFFLSNRNALNQGTDMILSQNRENGLRITSSSDIVAYNHDSIMLLTPPGLVGINNSNPQERLDLRGNMNITGTIKTNGDAGSANQVLMKNGSGSMVWGDISSFKNFESFYTSGSYNWLVPVGVTSILVELTGGGAGGIIHGGGGGGGYIGAQFIVTPGTTLNFTVGGGSLGSAGGNSVAAGSSIFTVGSVVLTAEGGLGTTFNNTSKLFSSAGGVFFISPSTFRNYVGIAGAAGEPNKITFEQKSATSFFEISSNGVGGGPGYCRECTGKGAYYSYDISAAVTFRNTFSEFRIVPGGGGGGGYQLSSFGGFGSGGAGKDGVITIHY